VYFPLNRVVYLYSRVLQQQLMLNQYAGPELRYYYFLGCSQSSYTEYLGH